MHWRRKWQSTPVFLPGESQGWRSLVGCCLWGHTESDTTERPHFHFSLSCIGEGNGNPLQCSCRENPRDSGAWWAAVSGVAQIRTQLKRLSSSSSSSYDNASVNEYEYVIPYWCESNCEMASENWNCWVQGRCVCNFNLCLQVVITPARNMGQVPLSLLCLNFLLI